MPLKSDAALSWSQGGAFRTGNQAIETDGALGGDDVVAVMRVDGVHPADAHALGAAVAGRPHHRPQQRHL